jgi:hypothetical protein
MGYGLDDRVQAGSRIFAFPYRADLLSNGYWGFFSWGMKQPGREADL